MPTQKITRSNLPGALKAHAIIIAINRYEKIGAHLRTPTADGKAIQEVLINYQGFAEENVHTCYDPTKAELEKFFATIQQNGTIKPQDGILFYYAGHGLAGDLDGAGAAGYLMPSDVSFSMAELSKNDTLVKMEWVFEQLDIFDCHHTLAIMDCCFAGAFRRMSLTRASMGLGLRPMSQERFKRYQEKRAWQVLASAGPAEKAADLISERGETSTNSPFAEALVDALSGKARPDFKPPGKNLGDGVLTTHELFIYLHDEVERRTRKSTAFKPQNPDLFPMGRHDGGQFIFCDPRHPQNHPNWDQRKRKNPYKGLEQYDLADADYYFGRNTDLEELQKIMQLGTSPTTESLAAPPTLLAVTGASGSGKSSLVKAGLLPLFQQEGYQVFQLRPGHRPWSVQQLTDGSWVEVLQTGELPPKLVAEENDKQDFYFDPQQKKVLYIDQFEELFSACTEEELSVFDHTLRALFVQAIGQEMKIVISLRSDFEWQLELSSFGRQFWSKKAAYHEFYSLYRVRELKLDDLRSALVNPSLLLAYEFEKDEQGDLIDTILEDLKYSQNALPLLSFTMQEMVNETSQRERLFKRSVYTDKIGGVSGALGRRMEAIYNALADTQTVDVENEQLPSPRQKMMRNVFLRMVNLSDGDYARRRVYRDQVADEFHFLADNKEIDQILKSLRDANLISTGGEAGMRYDELVHDSLINSWTTGKQWIHDFGVANLQLQRQLWEAVREYLQAQVSTPAVEKTGLEVYKAADHDLSQLWDTSAKLMQVLAQVVKTSRPNIQTANEEILAEMRPHLEDEEWQAFTQGWQAKLAGGELIDLNAFISLGISDKLLALFLKVGDHWMNKAEVDFVQKSWEKRIGFIIQLKRERDEAIQAKKDAQSVACAARAREVFPKDNTFGLNLVVAAYERSPVEETTDTLYELISNQQASFYQQFPQQERTVSDLVFTPDGQGVVLGDLAGNIKIYGTDTQEKLHFTAHEKSIIRLVFSPDKQWILSSSQDGVVKLWDREGNVETSFTASEESINALAFSPDGQSILTGGSDKLVRLWDLTGTELAVFTGHEISIMAVCFSTDGQEVHSICQQGILKTWNLKGKELASVKIDKDSLASVAFSPTGEILASSNYAGEINVWNLQGEKQLGFASTSEVVTSIAFSPDGHTLLTGGNDGVSFFVANTNGKLKLWNLEGQELQHFNCDTPYVPAVAFSPDGNRVLNSNVDGTVNLWPLSNNRIATLKGHKGGVKATAFSPDGKTIFTAGSDKTGKLWTKEGKLLCTFQSKDRNFYSVRFSPDGQTIFTGSDTGMATLWNLEGEELLRFEGRPEKFLVSSFSPDGKMLLTNYKDGKVRLWTLDGEVVQTIKVTETDCDSLTFSLDGQSFFTGSNDGYLKQWNLEGKEVLSVKAHNATIGSLALAPDGKHILTSSFAGGNLKLWDFQGEEIQIFKGHGGGVVSLAFSPDGQQILSGSIDHTARLWNLAGETIQIIREESSPISSVAFSPEGNMLCSGQHTHTTLWRNVFNEIQNGTLWNRIHKLTPEEKAKYKIDWDY